MKELVLATRNRGKLKEIEAMLPQYTLLTLDDIRFSDEIDEPFKTFRENAHIKAATVHKFCGKPVFADDSGLSIDALEGRPGVDSAIYAGLPRSDSRNVAKVLDELSGHNDRSAHFISIICFTSNGGTHYFEGRCNGKIAVSARGENGFGYDPVFIPAGFTETLGELDASTKNRISHRAKSIAALVSFLQSS